MRDALLRKNKVIILPDFVTPEMVLADSLLDLNNLPLLKEVMHEGRYFSNVWLSDWYNLLEYMSDEERFLSLYDAVMLGATHEGKKLTREDRIVIFYNLKKDNVAKDLAYRQEMFKHKSHFTSKRANDAEVAAHRSKSKGAPWEGAEQWDKRAKISKTVMYACIGIASGSFIYAFLAF